MSQHAVLCSLMKYLSRAYIRRICFAPMAYGSAREGEWVLWTTHRLDACRVENGWIVCDESERDLWEVVKGHCGGL